MTNPFRVTTLPASEAVPKLREMLNSGGFAYITIGEEERCLNFNPIFHCPMTRLPWPFSKLQQQGCCIEVTAASADLTEMMSSGVKFLRKHDYTLRSQHNEAIATFLAGADPEAPVDFHPIS